MAPALSFAPDLLLKAQGRGLGLKAALFDVDGVLTDGRIYVDDDGREFKAFSALDGVGLNLLRRANVTVAWITGSAAPAVAHRARQLDIQYVILDAADKLASWSALRADLGMAPEQCAHIGDDLPDLPLMRACVLAATVPAGDRRSSARTWASRTGNENGFVR